jgi:hypothetical protein
MNPPLVSRLLEAEREYGAAQLTPCATDYGALFREAREEIERLRADAERIEWLAAHPREATVRIGADFKPCVFYGVSCHPKWSAREAIDAAIDAARKP